MVGLAKFLTAIRDIRARNPTYRQGGSGVDGTCDCIGLIIGAVRRAGGTWTGTHGSNYAARSEMAGGLRRITSAADLEVGEAIYKARAPGAAGYDLPSKYQSSGDLLDYYHVGVVMSVSPLEIWHCTGGSGGGGIKVDTKMGAWAWAGRLKKITYEGADGMETQTEMTMGRARVISPDGNPVKLRATPDTVQPYLAKVPVGDIVDVLEVGSAWCTVAVDGKRGYMMREFLALEGGQEEPEDAGDTDAPQDDYAALLARVAILEARMDAWEAGA